MKGVLRLGVCGAALIGAPAVAQVNAPGTAPAEALPVAPVPDAARSQGITEIIVTAERRTSTAQKTAAAITVIDPTILARQQIVDVGGLGNVLPNTQIYAITNNLQVAIRGLGSTFIDPRADPMVAVSLNGLFLDRTLPGGFALLDVSRVEALNGPQGTLYGRNAAAGALNIITNEPNQKLGGLVSGTVGNYATYNVSGVLNVPITSTLAIRAAYERDRSDGYLAGYQLDTADTGHFKNYFNDVHTDLGRLSALWKPSDRFSLYAEWDRAKQGGHGATQQPFPCPGSVRNNGNIIASCSQSGLPFKIPNVGFQASRTDALQLRGIYDFGPVTLTSITGYVYTHTHYFGQNGSIFASPDPTLSGDEQNNKSHDFSQEVRLAGKGSSDHAGGLSWVLGGFYFHSTGNYVLSVPSIGGGTHYPKLPQNSKAVFAQATYGLTDNLRLTGGIRYTDDYKGLQFAIPGAAPFSKIRNHNVSYKGGVEYQVAPRNLLYANVSTGYISGGSNAGLPSASPPPYYGELSFKPEKLTSFEVGSKNRFFDNKLQLNAAAYYYKFKNYQLFLPALSVGAPGPQTVIQNVPHVKTYGLELSAAYQPTPDDRFDVSAQFAHGEMGHADLVTFAFSPTGFIGIPYVVNSGTRLLNLPHWQTTVSYSHRFHFESGASLDFAVSSKISGNYLTIVPSFGQYAPWDKQGSYTRTDLSLAYNFKGDALTLRGWVKNVEDHQITLYGEGYGYDLYSAMPPRTYGATLTAKF